MCFIFIEIYAQDFSYTNREMWDTQFLFSLNKSFRGIASDGEYLYASERNTNVFTKMSVEGNIIDSINIPGLPNIGSFTYDGQYFYGLEYGIMSNYIYVMDFENSMLIDTIVTPEVLAVSITYNKDLDIFYSTMHYGDIAVFNKNGDKLDELIIPDGPFVNHLAYDGWTEGGPYLYFMTFTSLPGDDFILKQYSLTTYEYTGFEIDLEYLGGVGQGNHIYTVENLINGTVTLGGYMSYAGSIVYGLELDSLNFECNPPANIVAHLSQSDVLLSWETPAPTSPDLAGYNLYRNDSLLNSTLIVDTTYTDGLTIPGTFLYNVTAVYVDSNSNIICESSEEGPAEVTYTPPSLILGGNIFVDEDKLNNGVVTASVVENNIITDQFTVDIIDSLGYYFFFPMDTRQFYIQAIASPLSQYSDLLIPTYYGNSIHWEDAETVILNDNVVDADINMISRLSTPNGIGEIRGFLTFESQNEGTINSEGILIYLLNYTEECVAFDYTNSFGEFSFSGLPIGTYKILVEIIGKKMTPASIIISTNQPVIENIQCIVSDNEVMLGVNDVFPEYIEYISEIYPNPSRGNIGLEIKSVKSSSCSLKMFDITGVLANEVDLQINIGVNKFNIDCNSLSDGIFLLKFSLNDGYSVTKKVSIIK